MGVSDLCIQVVTPGSNDPRGVGTVVSPRKGTELNGKARLFTLLAAQGLRTPPAVCVNLPTDVGFGNHQALNHARNTLLERLVRTGLTLLRSECVAKTGNEPSPLRLAMRLNSSTSGQWLPACLNVVVRNNGTKEEDHKRVVAELLRWLRASPSSCWAGTTEPTERHTTEILMQKMCPAMVTNGDSIGWVYTRNPVTGGDDLKGYVRVVGWDRKVQYQTYAEWSARRLSAASELANWIQHLNRAIGTIYRVCFGLAANIPYVLSLHAVDVAATVRWKLAKECVERGLLPEEERILMMRPEDLRIDAQFPKEKVRRLPVLASTEPLGALAGCGRAAYSQSQVNHFAGRGEPVVWVKEALTPDDIPLLEKVVGIVTRIGGPASHVVVLARARGVAILPGIRDIALNVESGSMVVGSCQVQTGEWLTIEESTGTVYVGKIEMNRVGSTWAAEVLDLALRNSGKRLLVNADCANDVLRGIQLGARGVGLCRSENHLLADPDALAAFKRWLVGCSNVNSVALPEHVLTALGRGLSEVLVAADGRRVHYRLLDPHLDEFLPLPASTEAAELASDLHVSPNSIDRRLRELRALGTVHGYRGCRWGLHTGFYRQQLRVVVEVAQSIAHDGKPVRISIVVPMLSVPAEMLAVRQMFQSVVNDMSSQTKDIEFDFGCMTETPRACLVIACVAQHADVLCFGTNDLTEAVWALDRDSGTRVGARWLAEGVIEADPFLALDREGVGALIARAIAAARLANSKIEIIVCGEQADDPRSAVWFMENEVNRVSCQADAIPAVALAVSQAELTLHGHRLSAHYPVWRPGAAEVTDRVYDRIHHAHTCGANELARKLAVEWGTLMGIRLSIPKVGNWKFFKRDVVQHWFGKRECRRFPAGWRTKDVLQYALHYRASGHTVRYSLFPDGIACHAVSKVLDNRMSIDSWRGEIEGVDHDVPLEVFPQRPVTDICFRAVFWGSHIDLEAGIGQAMYVFEEERGQHQVLRALMDHCGSSRIVSNIDSTVNTRLAIGLRQLLERYGMWIYLRLWDMSNTLGTAWLGVEGYYDPQSSDPPFICDMDLPNDLAFLVT